MSNNTEYVNSAMISKAFLARDLLFLGSQGSDEILPPPKPSRYPGSEIEESNTSLAALDRNPPPVSSYIVAQNPEVLVHLLKENESRGLNPSVYMTPASAFNTIAVDFKKNTVSAGSGFSDFSATDKTISAGNSMQSLNSLSSGISVAHSSACCTDSNFVPRETFVNVPVSSIANKSLPRNFGSGGGKLSARMGRIVDGPRKSFSISSGEINEPINFRTILYKIPHRMSRSADSTSVLPDTCRTNEVRLFFLFRKMRFSFEFLFLQTCTCMTTHLRSS